MTIFNSNYWVFILLIFLSGKMLAQNDSLAGSVEDPLKKVLVTKVIQLKTSKTEAALGDYIKVNVRNMEELLKVSKQKNEPIILYFNEIPMRGIYAHFISTRDSSIIFQLTRDTVSLKSWNIFYLGQTMDSKRQVKVSLGFENNGSVETNVKNFTLILVRKNLLIFALIGLAGLLVLFIVLVKKTGIIRDENLLEKKGSYSLARTQLACWSFIIIFSFLYIWIITGEIPPITGSTLVLLTISMTTTAGAKVIESSKNPENKLKNSTSEGFFRDIISDYNGVSIHRFQMVVWTILLGIFFLRCVIKSLSMPQFDESMLILMGISSGTYLGLKIPEKNIHESATVQTPVQEEEPIIDDSPAVG